MSCTYRVHQYTSTSSGLTTSEWLCCRVVGILWLQVEQWLNSGCIITCTAKQKHTPRNAAAPSDVLLNHPYSIIDTRVLGPGGGIKLIRVHCPWGLQGMWQGAWGNDSPEWRGEDVAGDLDDMLLQTLEDPSTFWISYW